MPGAIRERGVCAPAGEVNRYAAGVQRAKPLECVVVDGVRSECAIGGEESLCKASGSHVDDGTQHAWQGERGIGQQQVRERKVVRGVCNLARRPVKDNPLIVMSEHVERVQVTVTDHPHT